MNRYRGSGHRSGEVRKRIGVPVLHPPAVGMSWCKHMVWKFLLLCLATLELVVSHLSHWWALCIPVWHAYYKDFFLSVFLMTIIFTLFLLEKGKTRNSRSEEQWWQVFLNRKYNKANVMLFLLDSWFHFSLQLLIKQFEMHGFLLWRSLQTGEVTS